MGTRLLKDLLKAQAVYISLLKDSNEEIICRHISLNKEKRIGFAILFSNDEKFYLNEKSPYQFYIDEENIPEIPADFIIPEIPHSEDAEMPPNYGEIYRHIEELSIQERTDLLEQSIEIIEKNLDLHNEEDAHIFLDRSAKAALINTATVNELHDLPNSQAKEYTKELVKKTNLFVRAATDVLSDQMVENKLLQDITKASNGTVAGHISRVFVVSLSFLLFYNDQLLHSGIASKYRSSFSKKFKKTYAKLLHNVEDVTLEHIFKGGMRAVSPMELYSFSMGFLLHDIGKIEDIEYHEGELGYDRERVTGHVYNGFKTVTEKTNYNSDISYIIGFHHEYYGASQGYGVYRNALKKYGNDVQFAMGFDADDATKFKAHSFFPAKLLEIVDVFDALTDKQRKYKTPMTSEEALDFMEKEFILNELKIDPILFDLFRVFQDASKIC